MHLTLNGNQAYLRISTDSAATAGADTLPALNITNLTCREDFFERNFTCLPRCDMWDVRKQNILVPLEDIMRIVCRMFQILIVGLLLLLFVVRRKAL